ncbi:glycosyltransferase family 1 protein [Bacillus sp. V3B]|uniref:glycosyltransferase family 1 protein n=1 Tax=Bacillus sp. V3B TaxID=2804915 RepID=UPI00210DAF17|nr:glycosyltransferase family 1 protein [Bacillus sp. V3B]MCQ6275278.1 glycosyltransferase family 1 protein [Bacillus sp. V3B]
MGSPLRILHVVVNMNRGGAETLLMNLYRNIDHAKIQFDFLTCKPGAFDDEIKNLGGNIFRIPYISEVGHFSYVKALNKFFEENNEYQIVHSHMDKMSGLVLKATKKANIPYRISHSHNTSSEGGVSARFYKWMIGNLIKQNATHLLACSNEASKWLFKANSDKAFILKNGIELDKFKGSLEFKFKKREELHLRKDSFIIGHVGRFNHQKNHSFLVEIFSEVVKLNSNAFLVLVGDGPLKGDIQRKVNELGLFNKVRFLGVRDDVHQILQAFDVMLFPSIHEGLPVTLVEAQGAGLPCVISNVITNEVDIGASLIHYEDLRNSLQGWAKTILQTSNKRIDTSKYINESGFDIKASCKWLEEYYWNLVFDSGEAKISV